MLDESSQIKSSQVCHIIDVQRSPVPDPYILMRVFQHSVTQRNARQEFLRNKKCCLYFLRHRRRCNGACGFLRRSASKQKRLLIFLIRIIGDDLGQSELRLRSTNSCGTATAVKVKGKGRTLGIAPQVRQAYLRLLRYMARTKQRRTYLPLNLPSRSRYSFTDHLRMEG